MRINRSVWFGIRAEVGAILSCCAISLSVLTTIGSAADKFTPDFKSSRFSQLSPEGINLLEEFSRAYAQLKTAYSNSSISARMHTYRVKVGKDGIRDSSGEIELQHIIDFDYRSRGGDNFRLDITSFKNDGTTLIGSARGLIHGGDTFQLEKNLETNKYAVRGYGKNPEEYLSRLYSYLFTIVPYSFGATLLEYEVFSREDAVIVSVDLRGEGRDQIALIETKITAPGVGENTTKFEFFRNRLWCVKQIEGVSSQYGSTGLKPLNRYSQRCEYDGANSEIPMLKSAVYEMYGDDESAAEPPLWSRQSIVVASFKPQPSDISDFTVDDLVSNAANIKERRSSYSWVLAVNGLVLVALGLLFARWSSNRRVTKE